MVNQCRLCNGTELKPWMRDGRNRDCVYYRCTGCGLWNYDMDCGVDQTQYTETYHSPRDKSWSPNRDNRAAWEALSGFVDEPGTLLDIGCGNGCLMYHAREAGWTVEGLELYEPAARAVGEDTGMTVRIGDFLAETPASDAGRYDVVVLRHVLEHLPDPHLAVQRIRERLRDGGLAFLEFPNTGSVSYACKRVLKNLGLRNRKYSSEWRPGHCNEYCRSAFQTLLDLNGFELVAWETYSNSSYGQLLYSWLPVASKARAVIRRSDASARSKAA